MSDTSNTSGSPLMAFILGGVVVALLGMGYFMYTGTLPGANDAEIAIDLDGE